MESIQDKIEKQIQQKGQKNIFIPQDFFELGSRDAVDQALSRLAKKGTLHRVGRGIYYYPVYSTLLKKYLLPSPDEVVSAIVKRENRKIQVTGAVATNALGLSTQVPAKVVYLTDGLPKKIKVGESVVEFRRVTPRSMIEAGTTVGLVVQALKYLGKEHVDEKVISHLIGLLSKEDKQRLYELKHQLPYWISKAIEKITTSEVVSG